MDELLRECVRQDVLSRLRKSFPTTFKTHLGIPPVSPESFNALIFEVLAHSSVTGGSDRNEELLPGYELTVADDSPSLRNAVWQSGNKSVDAFLAAANGFLQDEGHMKELRTMIDRARQSDAANPLHVHLAFVTQLAARLTRLTRITLQYPDGFICWCFDVFVAIIEGHIAGRRAANLGGGTLHTITIKEGVRLTGTARLARLHSPLPTRLDPPPTLDALTTVAGLWSGVGQQGGPLAQLESIGTIEIDDWDHRSREGIERLEEVLVARGCRQSLNQLHVDLHGAHVGRRTLPVLLALDRLVGACCRQDAPLTTAPHFTPFDLSLFYGNEFPIRPSPSFKTMLQQLARQATSVEYIFIQDGLTDPHTNPSPSAIDIASSLSFDEARVVEVKNARGFDPPLDTPSPHPTIITHLKPFPRASGLHVWDKLGGAAGQLLASKMPKKVWRVEIYRVPGAEKVGVLAALGRDREREVGAVDMREIGVDQLAGAVGRLPTIKTLELITTLPDDAEDAGSLVRTGLSSVIPHIMQWLSVRVRDTANEQHDSIMASLPDGTNIGALSITRVGRAGGDTWVSMTALPTARKAGCRVWWIIHSGRAVGHS
ncbi:unnamed protein product [Vitrella brassicaformis CCMP3155]|uniref:Uncharacterized protein n=1 Tax=Vitrella brassicaformis (strain CCMP3155) TaxID=1169540 RepID=A0A0G4FYG8_VITBC|nr:unnamed protein product [Vitrella brassicaformis CCMP3155]|eukprot:CEM20493.1 unnamed protein product [Vitrella brassicaformis CCMP3155]